MSKNRSFPRALERELMGSGVRISEGVKGGMDAGVDSPADMLKVYQGGSPDFIVKAVEEAVKAFRNNPDDAYRFLAYQLMHLVQAMQSIDPRKQMERKDIQGLSS